MSSLRLPSIVAVTAVFTATSASAPLRVLRVNPTGETVSPAAVVSITFDRPVAASLERTVDPNRIFSIEPAVPGTVEWRDPVTLYFTPTHPLPTGIDYTVTIADSFEAMDGNRLDGPFRHSFYVAGPQPVTGSPVEPRNAPKHLPADQRFALVVSAPTEAAIIEATTRVEFDALCRGTRLVRVRVREMRPIADDDPGAFRYAGGWQRTREADLRRVVELEPAEPLPLACNGALVMPSRFDPRYRDRLVRWSFSTYGPFRATGVRCAQEAYCPVGGIRVAFTTPVRGAELARRLRIAPEADLSVPDTLAETDVWWIDAKLEPRRTYTLALDPGLTDVFDQPLVGRQRWTVATTGYRPSLDYEGGRLTVERSAYRTLAVKHINLDTVIVAIARVPRDKEPLVLARPFGWGDVWEDLMEPSVSAHAVRNRTDEPQITGVRMPTYNGARPGVATLLAVKATAPTLDPQGEIRRPIALVQVTDLGLHARVGEADGAVWVTGMDDGLPREGATVTLYDPRGQRRTSAVTGADGLARFANLEPDTTAGGAYSGFEGYVDAVLGSDRAVVPLSAYDYDLSPWRFNVYAAWGTGRTPAAGAVFTERDIYRPGEAVHAKAIVRDGQLGALTAPAGDSLRWIFRDRDGEPLRDTIVTASEFGTADDSLTLEPDLPLGQYRVDIERRRNGEWVPAAGGTFRVAEYRPPEFLVTVTTDAEAAFVGDTARTGIEARYLFGAPMGRAAVHWVARQTTISTRELDVPNTDGYYVGQAIRWWENTGPGAATSIVGSGDDTLGLDGHLALSLELPEPPGAQPTRVTLQATVTDVNRQAVAASASTIVHPAAFYVAAKPVGERYFLHAGELESVEVLAITPAGDAVPGITIDGALVRREWHRVRRMRGNRAETVGQWVHDTVATCRVASGTEATCEFTPEQAGSYLLHFAATDREGRRAETSFYRWATGRDWVPWLDDSELKMDLVPDRERYTVGDTASVLVASPFTDADAWVTVEREGLIEQRRLRVPSGSFAIKIPITEAHAPNAFVSVLVMRGRSAPPGEMDDPGRPTIRVGYAELRVSPEAKRLHVRLEPDRGEYRPRDTARIDVRVTDASGTGRRSEVTLWAVDEGVLALTGFQSPDPIDLVYQPRGLGMRLASNLVSVAKQLALDEVSVTGVKGAADSTGGGGANMADILRSRFRSTAFFLASVITDERGRAVAEAELPDNLTTFRVMAVAVTTGDRYGGGESSLLVTRPLLARPALPRFVRPGDRFDAGVVVNHRLGGTPVVRATAQVERVRAIGDTTKSARLERGRGTEVLFGFRAEPADTATFRFVVQGGGEADAVESKLPVEPDFYPRAFTIAGVLHEADSVRFVLPSTIDPERSRLTLSLGNTPLGVIRGMHHRLHVYPYYCSEQIASGIAPLIALYRAEQAMGIDTALAGPRAIERIQQAVDIVSRRQNPDGGIGFWSAGDWTTPWLTAHVGFTLLDARAAGAIVRDSVLIGIAAYLTRALHQPDVVIAPVSSWYQDRRTTLRDRVAALDFLSRAERPDQAARNSLLRLAAQLSWEDRVRLAEIVARDGDREEAIRLLSDIWRSVSVVGRKAQLPDSAGFNFYFYSRVRPVARLLTATLEAEPNHALIGPLTETLIDQGRTGLQPWNTQDFAASVRALLMAHERLAAGTERTVRIRAAGRTLLGARIGQTPADSATSLAGLLGPGPADDRRTLNLTLDAEGGTGVSYYYLTVWEVPRRQPDRPDDEGISVERSYEDYESGRPISEVDVGELVRVRLKITLPGERHFLVLDDPLPAGLEAVDLSLRTTGALPPRSAEAEALAEQSTWRYGRWEAGWWSPFDHKELRDDRVVYAATVLWAGTYEVSYVARATTSGVFVRPPAQAQEMYNPGVHGRTDGGTFAITNTNRQEP